MDRQRAGLDDETLGFVLQTLKTVTERRLDKETRLHLDEEDEFPVELVEEMARTDLGVATANGELEEMNRVAAALEKNS